MTSHPALCFPQIEKAEALIGNGLFRPPYAQLRPSAHSAARYLQKHYQVVLWDVLSGDFDPRVSAEECLQNILANVRPGSIIVLHDNIKSFATLRYVLPRLLEALSAAGYRFAPVPVEVEAALEEGVAV